MIFENGDIIKDVGIILLSELQPNEVVMRMKNGSEVTVEDMTFMLENNTHLATTFVMDLLRKARNLLISIENENA
jgi:hypothetical protein